MTKKSIPMMTKILPDGSDQSQPMHFHKWKEKKKRITTAILSPPHVYANDDTPDYPYTEFKMI